MPKDILIAALFETYKRLLTVKQSEITEMYYNYDLSLAEIAEIKGISRQSVSDALSAVVKELNKYESALGLNKMKEELIDFSSSLDETAKTRLTEIID